MKKQDILEIINNIEIIAENFDIPTVDKDTNFWLIRSEGGLLYEEFIENSFVALAWNDILSDDINSISEKEDKDKLLDNISEKYKTDRPGSIFNKCNRFINHIKEGDYLMIPNKSNKSITFATAGRYYEDTNIIGNETEFKALKETGWSEIYGKEMSCPYFKRREIYILKTIPGNEIHPNLFKALISYHGLSDINEYSNDILSSIYSIYLLENNLNMVFDIKTKKPIDSEIFSNFISNTSRVIKSNNNTTVTVKSNVNSPGKIILDYALLSKDFILTNKILFLIIWISITGGKIGKFEINSILKTIDDLLNSSSKRKKEAVETESINIKNKKEQLILDKLKNIDSDTLATLPELANDLDLDTDEISKIIKVDFKNNKKSGDN